MNQMPKIVISRTIDRAGWNNTTVLKGDLVEGVRTLKRGGENTTILGSGSLVSQLAHAGLIDEYQLVVVPMVLGDGRRLFEPPEMRMTMRLAESRAFNNGNVCLRYDKS
jgi:dihydrofolate reductase